MRGFSKTQLLTWAVVLLVVLNLATIGAILYHNYQEKQASAGNIQVGGSGYGNPLNGRFLRQELGFDNTQMDQFRVINQAFRPAAMLLTLEIDSLKEEMFAALQAEQPDTAVISQQADLIGRHHSSLKMETAHFYQQLRNICTKQQQAQLEDIFRPLFINEQTDPDHEPGNPPGRHRGRRNY